MIGIVSDNDLAGDVPGQPLHLEEDEPDEARVDKEEQDSPSLRCASLGWCVLRVLPAFLSFVVRERLIYVSRRNLLEAPAWCRPRARAIGQSNPAEERAQETTVDIESRWGLRMAVSCAAIFSGRMCTSQKTAMRMIGAIMIPIHEITLAMLSRVSPCKYSRGLCLTRDQERDEKRKECPANSPSHSWIQIATPRAATSSFEQAPIEITNVPLGFWCFGFFICAPPAEVLFRVQPDAVRNCFI